MGTSFVGSDIQGWAALFDKWAMQKAFENEQRLQQGYQTEALQGPVARGLRQSTPERAQWMMRQGARDRTQEYDKMGQIPLGGGFSAQSNYNPSADKAYTDMLGGTRANLGSYSDWSFQQAINNLRNQQSLNQISNFAGGQARNVYPLSMYQAQHKYDWLTALGQMISAAGGTAATFANQPPPQGVQQYGQQIGPSQAGPIYSGGFGGPADWSGYGSLPPGGTSYNPYTDQSTIRYGGGWMPG